MTNTERLRQYITKASFSSAADRFSALQCLQEIDEQRRELQAERERLLDSLARAGLEASRMVRQERHEIAQWLDGQGQPGYAHDVRCRA